MLENLTSRIRDFTEQNHGEDVGVRRETLAFEERTVRIGVALVPVGGGDPRLASEAWEITCRDVLDVRMSERAGAHQVLNWADDHPLLWEHQQATAELYLHGVAPDPHAVMGAMWERHVSLVGEWLSFGRFLNRPGDVVRGGYGLLARGPGRLVRAYAAAITEAGLEHALLEGASGTDDDIGDGVSVLSLGDDFVVAGAFEAVLRRPTRADPWGTTGDASK